MIIRKTLEHQVLPVPFHILTLCGVWCPEFVQPRLRSVYYGFTYSVIITDFLLTVEVFIYLIIIIQNKKFDLDVFFIFISLVNGLYKALNILLTRAPIVHLLMKGFEDRWRLPRDNTEKQILHSYKLECWQIHLIYAGTCLAGVAVKLFGPMVKTNSDIELPTPAWYPYDASKPLFFWLTYVQQMLAGSTTISMHIGADTMLCGFMFQSCVQLKLLKHRLSKFFQLNSHIINHSRLTPMKSKLEMALIKQFIYDHQSIYSFANKINSNFSGWLTVFVIIVVPNICINVYLLSFTKFGINVEFSTSLMLFAISLLQIYLPCWYGNEIMLHSSEIVNAIYTMDWVQLTPTTRKILIIIMIRSSKPILLKTNCVMLINLNSFLSIMKTSYTALNVLQQTT